MSRLKYLLDISDYLVTFVHVAITGVSENISIPSDFNWEDLYTLSERHKLGSAVWRGIRLCNLKVPSPLNEKWYVRTQQALSKSFRFEHELAQIQSAFSNAGIDYVLMKGVTLQSYWPEKGLREFSDHDILVREEQRTIARDVMLSLGYTNDHFGGIHDVYTKEPIYEVEIHVGLFENPYHYAAFFQDIWNRVIPVFGMTHQYQFSTLDFYLYFVFHFLKHTQNQGSGLRFYADLYLLQEAIQFTTEEQRICNQILFEFDEDQRIPTLYMAVDALFRRKGTLSEYSKEFIFSGTAYGGQNQRIFNSLRKSGYRRYISERIFPPYSTMVKLYKLLQKYPFLLPLTWIHRWIHHLFVDKHRKLIAKEFSNLIKFTKRKGKEVE